MTTVTEITRLAGHYDLPEEVLELILKQVYRWNPPKVDVKGYVISEVNNIRKCPTCLVLDNVVGRHRWQHIARVPALHSYDRRVCLSKEDKDCAMNYLSSLNIYHIKDPVNGNTDLGQRCIGYIGGIVD